MFGISDIKMIRLDREKLEDAAIALVGRENAELARELVEDYSEALGGMDSVGEWNSLREIRGNIGEVRRLVEATVVLFEDIADQSGLIIKDSKKRAVIVAALDDAIVLPFYLEPFDGTLIGYGVDWVASELEERFGSVLNAKTTIKSRPLKQVMARGTAHTGKLTTST